MADSAVPTFLQKLWEMLADPANFYVISWDPPGLTFRVRSPQLMNERVLGKYFRHNNFSSFQRQLNYFSFSKCGKVRAHAPVRLGAHAMLVSDASTQQAQTHSPMCAHTSLLLPLLCTHARALARPRHALKGEEGCHYCHEHFVRHAPEKMLLIQRKTAQSAARETAQSGTGRSTPSAGRAGARAKVPRGTSDGARHFPAAAAARARAPSPAVAEAAFPGGHDGAFAFAGGGKRGRESPALLVGYTPPSRLDDNNPLGILGYAASAELTKRQRLLPASRRDADAATTSACRTR